jgi:dihydrofolate reductase
MGKVISLINITPDGSVDSQYAANIDAEFFEFTHDLLAETQAIVFGRNTFGWWQDTWQARLDADSNPGWVVKMAQALNEIPKHVYSSELQSTSWKNSTIIKTMDVDAIKQFKQPGQKGLLTFGSLSLVAALTEEQLIDDYYFCIHTLISGDNSVSLFDKVKLDVPLPLKLISTKVLQSGMVIIHYQLAN